MFTNRSRRFQCTSLIETDLSDFHKVIVSVFRAFVKRLLVKVTEYRNYKTFDHNEFFQDLDQELIKCNLRNEEQQYDTFTSIFWKVLDKHAPLKMKKLRENQAKFMTFANLAKLLWINQGLKINIQKGHHVKTSWLIKRQDTFATR